MLLKESYLNKYLYYNIYMNNKFLPNEILNIIFSYRGVHPIVKNTNLLNLIKLYNQWNDSKDETYISFCFFTTREVYNYNMMVSKRRFIEVNSEDNDKWNNGQELLFIDNKFLR
jgi:hypothetical protein